MANCAFPNFWHKSINLSPCLQYQGNGVIFGRLYGAVEMKVEASWCGQSRATRKGEDALIFITGSSFFSVTLFLSKPLGYFFFLNGEK